MSDRGRLELAAVCSGAMEVKALLKLIETIDPYGLEEDGAQVADIGYIDSSTWLVIAYMSECNGINIHKLADALDKDFKFKNPREMYIAIWQESMQDYYDVWEGMPSEEFKKYEECSSEPPTERAAKWNKLKEQVCKWYSHDEFLEIPENMLVQKLPDAFQNTLAKGCSLYQQDRRMHPSASVVALEKFSAFS